MKPYLIVFTASACTLIIEIVAGRILAPTIGVSLYTWTSIIGIVLAGISLGNYLGGRIADRYPSPKTLGIILLASGVASIAILPIDHFASDSFLSFPIIPRIVLLTITLFLIPAIILGMVSPVVIKLRLSDLTETGNVVGKIYAVSTAGSILGTFLTGFVLVQLLGTRLVILIVSLILIAMAIIVRQPVARLEAERGSRDSVRGDFGVRRVGGQPGKRLRAGEQLLLHKGEGARHWKTARCEYSISTRCCTATLTLKTRYSSTIHTRRYSEMSLQRSPAKIRTWTRCLLAEADTPCPDSWK